MLLIWEKKTNAFYLILQYLCTMSINNSNRYLFHYLYRFVGAYIYTFIQNDKVNIM